MKSAPTFFLYFRRTRTIHEIPGKTKKKPFPLRNELHGTAVLFFVIVSSLFSGNRKTHTRDKLVLDGFGHFLKPC